jgi:hypothetical protein
MAKICWAIMQILKIKVLGHRSIFKCKLTVILSVTDKKFSTHISNVQNDKSTSLSLQRVKNTGDTRR